MACVIIPLLARSFLQKRQHRTIANGRKERHGGPANRTGAAGRDWTLEAKPPDGPPWPGAARTTIEWHDSRAHLVQRSTVNMPEAPDGISIMGCDAANGTYFQLYYDERGVCRVYKMSIADGRWKL